MRLAVHTLYGASEPLFPLFLEYLRVLEDGRRLVVIACDEFDGRLESNGDIRSARIVQTAILAGFLVRQRIIWNDPQAGARWLAGKGFPHGPAVVVNQTFRDIFVFQKKDTWTSHRARYAPLTERLEPFDVMDRAFFERWVKKSIWEGSPKEIYAAILRMWSRPGETVICPDLDCGEAADKWKRNSVMVASGQHAENLRRVIDANAVSAVTARILS